MKLRSTIICLLAGVLFLFTVVPAQAVPIWGSDAIGAALQENLTSPAATSGVDATQQWYNGGFNIAWDITQCADDLWTYTYSVTGDTKGLFHFILEVTEDGEDFNIYGVKFDFGDTMLTYTMVTDRAPVYGVVYTKDGTEAREDVVAWSNALNYSDYKTNEVELAIIDFIVRPDGLNSGGSGIGSGDSISEPVTMSFLSIGLIGFAVSGKKRLKKRNG